MKVHLKNFEKLLSCFYTIFYFLFQANQSQPQMFIVSDVDGKSYSFCLLVNFFIDLEIQHPYCFFLYLVII